MACGKWYKSEIDLALSIFRKLYKYFFHDQLASVGL